MSASTMKTCRHGLPVCGSCMSAKPAGSFTEPCSVNARKWNDQRRGATTSQEAIDFVRSTCPCDGCKLFRKMLRAVGK